MKKYLEYKDEKSNKFWEIEVRENSHTVRYGKIGTDGQQKRKDFPSDDEALKDAQKLIASKISKGYSETGTISEDTKGESMTPREWAKSFFARLDAMIREIQNHPLVDRLVFIQYKGITDDEIESIQHGIMERLNEEDIVSSEFGKDFQIDPFMKEFYEISNGLHFAWSSHLFPPSIEESRMIKDASGEDFIRARDENDPCEGWVSILPLEGLRDHGRFNIPGDPAETGYGNELKEKGACLAYLDYYHYYYDTCIQLGGAENFSLAFGEDHSASYEDAGIYDFVIYMENLLARYGAVMGRRDLNRFEYMNKEIYEKIKAVKSSKDYQKLPALFKETETLSLDTVIKNNYEEKGYDYITWEHLESKPGELFKKMEEFLDLDLQEEFNL